MRLKIVTSFYFVNFEYWAPTFGSKWIQRHFKLWFILIVIFRCLWRFIRFFQDNLLTLYLERPVLLVFRLNGLFEADCVLIVYIIFPSGVD